MSELTKETFLCLAKGINRIRTHVNSRFNCELIQLLKPRIKQVLSDTILPVYEFLAHVDIVHSLLVRPHHLSLCWLQRNSWNVFGDSQQLWWLLWFLVWCLEWWDSGWGGEGWIVPRTNAGI